MSDPETMNNGADADDLNSRPSDGSKAMDRNSVGPELAPAVRNGAGGGRELGYMRVSTDAQTTALQHDALRAAGLSEEAIYTDSASGAAARPQLAALLDTAQEGDRITVWKFDRVGRSLSHFVQIIATLNERGVAFRSLTEGVDTSTAAGRMFAHVIAAMSEYERELIRERTRAGLAAARERGRVGGRPSASNPEQAAFVRRLAHDEGKSHRQIAALTGLTRATVGRILRGEVASLGTGSADAQRGEGD